MSDERDPATDQQLPVVNDNRFVQDMVIADIEQRKQFGIRKYGTALQAGNGRDMLLDAYEEALDLVIYLRGMLEEGKRTTWEQALRQELLDLRDLFGENSRLGASASTVEEAWEGAHIRILSIIERFKIEEKK